MFQMFGVSKIFFIIYLFIQQGLKKQYIYNVTKYSNTCSSELYIYQIILKKSIKVSTKILSRSTVFNIDNNTCFLRGKSAY